MSIFLLQTVSLSDLSPSLLANVGVLCMSRDDVGWRLILAQWVEHRPETDRDLVRDLCDRYMETAMSFMHDCTTPKLTGKPNISGHHFKRMVPQNEENIISTFCALFEVIQNFYKIFNHALELENVRLAKDHSLEIKVSHVIFYMYT